MFGSAGVARVMQLIGDGERLRVVARRLDMSPIVVSRLWRSYQGLESRHTPFPNDNPTRPFSYIGVSPQSHEYSSSPEN